MSGVDVKRMSAYTANNSDKNNSVYQKLKLAQKDVLAANCLVHILHSATRFADMQDVLCWGLMNDLILKKRLQNTV